MAIQHFNIQANNNTAIEGINIAEGCPPGNVNDAIRQLMSDIKKGLWGSAGTATRTNAGTVRFANPTEITEGKAENLVVTPLDMKQSETKLSASFTQQVNGVNAFSVPKGGIILWSGAINTIPAGWALCDGGNGTPNLRDRFVLGAGNGYAPNATGGTSTHAHTAGTSVYGSTLSAGQLAYHNHNSVVGIAQGSGTNAPEFSPKGALGHSACTYTGSNEAHSHTAGTSVQAGNHIPPYYALAYIMKL